MDVHREERVQVDKFGDNVVSRQEVVHDVAHERKGLLLRITQIIWLGTLALEILLGTRALLKLVAANPAVPFARFVYNLSEVFLLPFLGLTVTPVLRACGAACRQAALGAVQTFQKSERSHLPGGRSIDARFLSRQSQ